MAVWQYSTATAILQNTGINRDFRIFLGHYGENSPIRHAPQPARFRLFSNHHRYKFSKQITGNFYPQNRYHTPQHQGTYPSNPLPRYTRQFIANSDKKTSDILSYLFYKNVYFYTFVKYVHYFGNFSGQLGNN